MDIIEKEISNAFKDSLHTLINEPFRTLTPQEYENFVLRYIKSDRCKKQELAIELLKPDLTKKPEWANYYALNDYGVWLWFEKKPVRSKTGWTSDGKQTLVNFFESEDYLFEIDSTEKTELELERLKLLQDELAYGLISYLNINCKDFGIVTNKHDNVRLRRIFTNGIEKYVSIKMNLKKANLSLAIKLTEDIENLVESCMVDVMQLYVGGNYECFYGRFKQFFEKQDLEL